MQNWIVQNRTICIKIDLALNNQQRSICRKNPNNLYFFNASGVSEFLPLHKRPVIFNFLQKSIIGV